ncbi:putative Ig domain-containing protein [Massilia mucilaginosa]|nr:putative Ig domain-containing protein [Massilia mucilaginosa]
MTLPTAVEITNFYLYGKTAVPADLTDAALVRSSGIVESFDIAVVEYMAGPGRFVVPADFEAVNRFLSPTLHDTSSHALVPGVYDKKEIFATMGIESAIVKVNQSWHDDHNGDYLDRAYIWGNTAFYIASSARFIIEKDGRRHIEDFAILPYVNKDSFENFDLTGGDIFTDFANNKIGPRIDPSSVGRTEKLITGLGRRINFRFTNEALLPLRSVNFNSMGRSAGNGVLPIEVIWENEEFLTKLWNARSTRFIDNAGRGIVYGTDNADVMDADYLKRSKLSFDIDPRLKKAIEDYGVAIVGAGGADELTGGVRGDALYGGIGNDTLTGGAGKDKLLGGVGNDKLDGGTDNDLLNAGEGDDTYVFSGNYGNDVIYDLGGVGRIQIDGVTIGKGIANGKRDQWRFDMGGGVSATLSLMDSAESSTGKKLVIAKGNDSNNSVSISNFDLAKAQAGGYLGIQLDGAVKAAIKVGGGGNVWNQPGFDGSLSGSTELVEGTGRTFTLYLNQAAKAGQTVTLKIGGTGDSLKAILGDVTVPASGALIPLVEGQTQVSFALVQEGPLSTDASATVAASVSGKDGLITTNTFNLVLKNSGDFTRTLRGDQSPPLVGEYYDWSKTEWLADGTMSNGVTQPNFPDVLRAGPLRDRLLGMGGNDALDGAGDADYIDGGDGDDMIGGGPGSDYLLGGAGKDHISSSSTLNMPRRTSSKDTWKPPEGKPVVTAGPNWGVYVKSVGDSPVNTWDGVDDPFGADSDYIDGGAGDDTLISSDGADRVLGGTGNDRISGRAGDDVLEGNDGNDNIDGDGTTVTGLLSSVSDSIHGHDFVDGGAGNDTISGDGGSDVVFGGADNDKIWGDSAGKTDAKNYAGLQFHGEDYLDGEDGDDYIEGGARNDTLYGGLGADNLLGDTSAANLSSPADNALIWGEDYLDGEEGNDSLTGGGGNDAMFGGTGDDKLWGDSSGASTDESYIKAEFQGNDYLDGEDGKDFLQGGGKNDTLYGGAGDDALLGDMYGSQAAGDAAFVWGNDYLVGEEGKDTIEGGGGDDTLSGGTGNDFLFGDEGRLTLNGKLHGNDLLEGGEGDDQMAGGGGKDSLIGGAGNDLMWGDDEAAKLLVEWNDSDFLDGGDGNDQLVGGGGDDVLLGGAGDDVLDGGSGADILDGGEGNDSYTVDNVGDVIRETAPPAPATASKQSSTSGGLDQSGDALMMMAGSSAAVVAVPGIDYVTSSVSYQLGDNLENLTLTGNGSIDGSGNELANSITGNALGNTLAGGGANDWLKGGAGNDVYLFNRGDGADAIDNTDLLRDTANPATVQAVDVLRFGAGIAESDILAQRGGNDMVLSIKDSSDQIFIKNYYAPDLIEGTKVSDQKIDRIEFADGVVWTAAQVDAKIVRQQNNKTPVGGPGIPYLSARAGVPFSYTLAAANLTEPDADDKLNYSVTMSNNSPVPAWLKFDAATRTLSGVPDAASVGNFQVSIKASDNYGASAIIGIGVNIGAANLPPEAKLVLNDLKTARGMPLSYTLPTGLFVDPDKDAMTYSVTLDSGGGLPSWLKFNAATGVLSGTSSTLERLVLAVTATDANGLSTKTLLKLDVENRAPTVVVVPKGSGGAANDLWQLSIPAGSFADADAGDILSYSASAANGGPLPAWLKFDPATLTFSGIPPVTGPTTVLITASDSNGALVSAPLTILIDPNEAYTGTAAAEQKEGGWGHDTLKGLAGNDTLLGGFGNDRLEGGVGNDLLKGGGGADTYVFGKGDGNDTIDNQDMPSHAGVDTIEFLPGVAVADVKPVRVDNDLILSLPASGDSVRVLNYFKADELALSQVETVKFADGTKWTLANILPFLLTGTAGNDKLYGSDANDLMDGKAGNDRVEGFAGNDTLAGGAGNDDLIGGGGTDTYRFNKGDGKDTISDVSPVVVSPEVDRLEFGAGLAPADVEATRDGPTLRLNFGATGDGVTIWSYFSGRTDLNLAVEQIAFADGTLWTIPMVHQLTLKGTDLNDKLEGFAGNDLITGRKGQDTLLGLSGNDSLSGGEGNDTLDGGAGDDVLGGGPGRDRMVGGAGNDTFLFGKGDGPDAIVVNDVAAGKVDTIRIADGVLASDVLVERWENKLVLTILPGDTLFVEDYFLSTNGVRTGKIEQVLFADGSSWNTAAIDQMAVPHRNEQPLARDTILPMYGNINSPFSVVLPTDRHEEYDRYDVLSFNVGPLPGYPALPSWLNFDPLTMRLWGTPAASDQGKLVFYLYGTDLYGESAKAPLNLTVGPASVAPTVKSAIPDVATSEGSSFQFSLGDVFADADQGDVLTYSATLSTGAVLPEWLTFDPVLRRFSGWYDTPSTVSVKVTGTDLSGKSASDEFDIVVSPNLSIEGTPGNDVLNGGPANDRLDGLGGDDELDGGPGYDVLLGGTGNDTYSIYDESDLISEYEDEGTDTVRTTLASYALPDNVENVVLSGEGEGAVLTGNTLNNHLIAGNGIQTIDGGLGKDTMAGGAGDDVYLVDNTLDVVVELAGDGDDHVDASATFTLPANVESLTLTGEDNIGATGNADSNLIVGNAGNNRLDGGAGMDRLFGMAGDDTYIIDSMNDEIEDESGIDTIERSFDSHYYLMTEIENLTLTGNAVIGYGNELDNVVTGNGLNNNLSGFAGNDRLFGKAGNDTLFGGAGNDQLAGGTGKDYLKGEAGDDVYLFERGDGNDQIDNLDDISAVDTLRFGKDITESDIKVEKNNGRLILTIKGTTDSVFFANYFSPDAINNGVSANNKIERIEFANGITWNQAKIQSFIDSAAANNRPDVKLPVPAFTAQVGKPFTYTVAAGTIVDPDPGDSVTYSIRADKLPLPAWLKFDPASRTLAGTPALADIGTTPFLLMGTDNYGLAIGTYVSVVVNPANRSPVLSSALADQSNALGTAFSYVLPAGAFTDPDAGTVLSYSATLADGAALPTWLSFNATTRTFGGTAATAGKFSVKVSARDSGNLSASDVFDLTVGLQNQTLSGTASADQLNAGAGNDVLNGMAGNDALSGGAGNDTLDGGAGTDTMTGGAGDDTYMVEAGADKIIESASGGTDVVRSTVSYILPANVENLTLTGTALADATGNELNNVLVGNAASNVLNGMAGIDTMTGGAGDDVYIVDNISDVAIEAANEGSDTLKSIFNSTLAANIEALFLTGSAGVSGTGNTLNNLLVGNIADNALSGDAGNDLLQGGAGDDTLTDTVGNNLLNGGAGADKLTGGLGKEMLMGGAGSDVIVTGGGADIIAFNRGDGQDVVNASAGKDDTVSLGKGVLYADLLFKKTANDLILVTGASEQITFKDWYAAPANRSVANLQMVIEGGSDYNATSANKLNNKKVEQFNFDGLVGAFDAARTATPAMTSWALSTSLLNFYLSGSDTAAIGGDLAYQYAGNGNLSSMSMLPAGALLSSPAFGVSAQPLQAGSALRDLSPQLV